MEYININQTEYDVILEAMQYAQKAYQNNCTPAEGDIERQSTELYNKLFGYRDNKKETALDRPVAYSLVEIFKELKFGRPSGDQKFLDKCIDELNSEF